MRRKGDTILATRMDVLARRRTTEFAMADVVKAPATMRPFVTFEAAGVPYFVTKSGFADAEDADAFGV